MLISPQNNIGYINKTYCIHYLSRNKFQIKFHEDHYTALPGFNQQRTGYEAKNTFNTNYLNKNSF